MDPTAQPVVTSAIDSIPLIAVPVLNRGDLLRRLVHSIDKPVSCLLIINNGRDPGVAEALDEWQRNRLEFVGELRIVTPRCNLGVAASWNLAIRQLLMDGLPYMIVVGSDICFMPGDLEIFHRSYDPSIAIKCGNHGYSLFSLTAKAIDVVGFFDENFYPAYLEDCDYQYRLKLAGLESINLVEIRATHGDSHLTGSCTIQSDPELFREIGRASYRERV